MISKKIVILIILYIIYIHIYKKYFKEDIFTPKMHLGILLDNCDLSDLDPWDPTIYKFLNASFDPLKNCFSTSIYFSQLIGGQLFINDENGKENISCQYRCLLPDNDYKFIFGNWIKVINGTSPECDIIEIECQEKIENKWKVFYKFLHSQTYRKDKFNKLFGTPPDKPDVYILVFDSVSESQFFRSLPKTQHFLREYYETIPFRHLNKVGYNSRPNAFAMLMGKLISPIAKSPVSRGHPSDYRPINAYCNEYLDNDQFIAFHFQDDDYITMMSEDWPRGVFNWPNCSGFANKPVDHYMRPFQQRSEIKEIMDIIYKDSCREGYYYQIEYLQNFIDTYPDRPKFSLTWMTNLTHNNPNSLYHTDDYFYNFFKNNKEKLKNAFVFLVADHGMRFTPIRNTEIGEVEDNNPLMVVSIPEKLRRDTIFTEILKQNAKNLITHYDIYATLFEIAKPPYPRIKNPLIKGSSLFRPLPSPRTCDLLRIPFEYCNCKRRLPKRNKVSTSLAELIISRMNANLRETNETIDCMLLTLNLKAPIISEGFQEKNEAKVYQVKFSTLPGNGEFSGYVVQKTENGSFEILSEKFNRMNVYAHQATCASSSKYAPYCFCKNLIK